MEPSFITADDRSLLVTYHPPTQLFRDEAVLICPPFFGEYLRSHAALRRLAGGLADTGYHVMRLDYSGTGDSSGAFGDATVDNWATDVHSAIAELKAVSGVNTVQLVGVRYGALVAAIVAVQDATISRLVMWDPVVRGDHYLEQLEDTHKRLLDAHVSARPAESPLPQSGELAGFAVNDQFLRMFAESRMPSWSDLAGSQTKSTIVVVSGNSALRPETLEQISGAGIQLHEDTFDCDWSTYTEAVLLPHSIVEALKGAL